MEEMKWEDEVEGLGQESEDTATDNMVANPEVEDDKVEYEVAHDDKDDNKADNKGEKEETDVNADEVERIKYKIKQYDKLRRQTYAQAEQLRRLQAERDHFQIKALEQYETNLSHNKGLLNNKLEMAKAKLEIAIEGNDASSIANANAEIATITGDIRDLDKHFQELNFSKEKEKKDNEYQTGLQQQTNEQNASWFYDNPEFNPQNPKYDRKLQREFINYAKEIDEELISQGKANVIGTQEYYNYFDNVMDNYREAQKGSSNREEQPKRSSSFNPVAPISRGNTSGGTRATKSKQVVRISPEEARINKLWGITPKEHVEFTRSWQDKDFETGY